MCVSPTKYNEIVKITKFVPLYHFSRNSSLHSKTKLPRLYTILTCFI